jgi:hypothetical protein
MRPARSGAGVTVGTEWGAAVAADQARARGASGIPVGAHPRPAFPLAVAPLAGAVPRARMPEACAVAGSRKVRARVVGRVAEDRYSEPARVARVSASTVSPTSVIALKSGCLASRSRRVA